MKHTISTLTRGLLLVLGLALGTPFHAQADESTVRVMSYNIYRGGEMLGQPLSQTVKVIQEAKADIVGIQEPKSPKGFTTEKLASLLGWNHSANIRKGIILTPYEIVETSTVALRSNCLRARKPMCSACTCHQTPINRTSF